jgi:O-antigen biosynthesis protein
LKAGTAPAVSLIVCTYDRPGALQRCLHALLEQRTSFAFEVVVVDNHPQSGLTTAVAARFAAQAAIRWVEEPRPRLSLARNRGIAEARGGIVAYADDDVLPPPEWLETLTAPLLRGAAEIVAVTGNCLAMKQTTQAERLFEAYGGLRHGDQGQVFDGAWMGRWRVCFPEVWRVGTTANAAFRREVFDEAGVGWFDPRLGPGSPAGAWEDLYCFYRVLGAGHRIQYVPEAWVLHAHREEMSGLRRQLQGYRRGEVAFLLLVLTRHGDMRALGQMFFWIPRWRAALLVRELLRRVRGRRVFSLRLFWAECVAYLSGGWAFWRSRVEAAKMRGPEA